MPAMWSGLDPIPPERMVVLHNTHFSTNNPFRTSYLVTKVNTCQPPNPNISFKTEEAGYQTTHQLQYAKFNLISYILRIFPGLK